MGANYHSDSQGILTRTLLSPPMSSRVDEAIEQSTPYRLLSLVQQWAVNSTVGMLLTSERVLVAALSLFLVLSIVRVLTSTMGAPVKFLSFALLFVLITALTWNYTEPGADS